VLLLLTWAMASALACIECSASTIHMKEVICCETMYVETRARAQPPKQEVSYYTSGHTHVSSNGLRGSNLVELDTAHPRDEDCEGYRSSSKRRRCRKAQYNRKNRPIDEDHHIFKPWEEERRFNPIWYVVIFFGIVLIGGVIFMLVK
jgi:hypothetical protein